jgi:hypothetical protein
MVRDQHHAPAALYPQGKDPRYPLYSRLGGPVWTQKLKEKSSDPVWDRTPIVQPVVRHYTAWATAAPVTSWTCYNTQLHSKAYTRSHIQTACSYLFQDMSYPTLEDDCLRANALLREQPRARTVNIQLLYAPVTLRSAKTATAQNIVFICIQFSTDFTS